MECSDGGSGGSGSGSNDAIRRVMQNDVTLGAGVTVLSQGQPVQGPAAQPPLNPWRATAPRSSSSSSPSSPRCSSLARSLSVRLFGVGTWELHSQIFRFAHCPLLACFFAPGSTRSVIYRVLFEFRGVRG